MELTRKEEQQTATDLQISKLDRCARQDSSSNILELVLDLSRKNHVKHGTINTTNRYDSQNLAKQLDEQYQQASPSNTQEQCHPTRETTMSPSSTLHLSKTMYIRRQMDNPPMCNVPSTGVTLVTPLSLQPTGANISLTEKAPTMTHIPYAEASLILPSTDKMTIPISFSTKKPAQASETNRKILRPFKVYPKNPPSLPMGPMLDYDSNERYEKFRLKMLEDVKKVHELSNPKMRRISKDHALPTSTSQVTDDKDTAYWERRKRNNAAAKRSRDARRAKEDELAIRVAFLEEENVQLKRILGKIHHQLMVAGIVYDPNWFN